MGILAWILPKRRRPYMSALDVAIAQAEYEAQHAMSDITTMLNKAPAVGGHATMLNKAPPVGVPMAAPVALYPEATPVLTGTVSPVAQGYLDKLMAHPIARTTPEGLCTALANSAASFPLRIMVLDNSGSMAHGDGKRAVMGDLTKFVSCTRWRELADDVEHIATLSSALGARTDFHLLNPTGGYDALTIGSDTTGIALGTKASLEHVKAAMQTTPNGRTPLTGAAIRIISMLEPHALKLRSRGERVVVILATDGLPDDPRSFLVAMQRLQALPVWLVVRLCTDDDSIVDYWNNLDSDLEGNLEVLDDWHAEAAEVSKLNPWLTYGAPLHHGRIFGLHSRLFDLIDEVALRPGQIKQFVEALLNVTLDVEPEVDPTAFVALCEQALSKAPSVMHPRKRTPCPWLDLRLLERAVRPQRCLATDLCQQMAGESCALCDRMRLRKP